MSNRLLVPKSKRFLIESPSILRPRSIIPGVMPIPRASKPPVFPGSQTFSTAGAFNFTIPNFNTLVVEIRGAGGGGGSFDYTTDYNGQEYYASAAGAGGASTWNGLTAIGGGAGTKGWYQDGTEESVPGGAGAAGAASGGDTNTTGGGNAGGAGISAANSIGGAGGNGGNGGYGKKTYTAAQLTAGAIIGGTVGAGGVAGRNATYWPNAAQDAKAGTGATITFTWS